MAVFLVIGLVLGFLVLYLVVNLLRFSSRTKYLPPGPPTIPILGNAHLLMGKNLHHKLRKWGNEYGSVYSLKIGKGTMIVLNSKQAVYDLIDKRGAIYSARPADEQVFHTMRGENLGLIDQTPLWKSQRKMVVQYLAPKRLDGEMAKVSEAEISVLMRDLLDSPQDFRDHVKRCGASAAAITIFGQRAATNRDFWGTGVYEATVAITEAMTPGSYLPTEQFPALKLFPQSWSSAKTRAQDAYKVFTAVAQEAARRVENRRKTHGPRNCLLDGVIDGDIVPDEPMHGSTFVNFFTTLWAAAADTTAVALLTNIRYLAAHPEVQRKAQAELDKVCGAHRPPTWADFDRLPYINCIMKEGLRIQGVVPLGFPHRATQDNWYNDMLIPRDATVMIPPFVLGRTQYPDGETYNPDRFCDSPLLASDYAASADYEKRDHYAYGAGRRICAGIQLAERTQWRVFARVLWAFEMGHEMDEVTGKRVEIDTEAFEHDLAPWPLPFKVKFLPRSKEHVEVLKRDAREAEEFLWGWE